MTTSFAPRRNADGSVTAPAFVDLTASLRFPATPDVEAPATLAAAARAGGHGLVLCAPLGEAAAAASGSLEGHLAFARHIQDPALVAAASPVRGNTGADQDPAEIASPARAAQRPAALRLTHGIGNTVLLRRVLEMARAHDLLVIAPSLDPGLAAGAVAVEGAIATRLGLTGVPEAAEAIEIARLIELARLTRARVHVAHVVTARGALAIERARAEGLAVSGCVSVLHLGLAEDALLAAPYDVALRCWPPLPSRASQETLRACVARGALCVSSGHAPAPKRERDLEWALATPGASTLADAASVVFSLFNDDEALRALATEPARILGLTAPPGFVRVDITHKGVVGTPGALGGLPTRGAFTFERSQQMAQMDGGAR